ncbi:hypothetical protein JCM5296_000045 [Sporobolomyces johnsonii]
MSDERHQLPPHLNNNQDQTNQNQNQQTALPATRSSGPPPDPAPLPARRQPPRSYPSHNPSTNQPPSAPEQQPEHDQPEPEFDQPSFPSSSSASFYDAPSPNVPPSPSPTPSEATVMPFTNTRAPDSGADDQGEAAATSKPSHSALAAAIAYVKDRFPDGIEKDGGNWDRWAKAAKMAISNLDDDVVEVFKGTVTRDEATDPKAQARYERAADRLYMFLSVRGM